MSRLTDSDCISFHHLKYKVQSMLLEHKSNSIILNDIKWMLNGTEAEVSYMSTDPTYTASHEKLGANLMTNLQVNG